MSTAEVALVISGLAALAGLYGAVNSHRALRWQRRRDAERSATRARIYFEHAAWHERDLEPAALAMVGGAENLPLEYRLTLVVVNSSETSTIYVRDLYIEDAEGTAGVHLTARFRHPLSRLGDLTSKVQYGSSSKAVEEAVGTPMLRMTNLQDGDWDLDLLKYTTLDEEEQEKYLLEKGDLCFTRTNGSKDLVGKCAVFREEGAWIYASYLIRVRMEDQEEYLPEFLARFLNSDVGRVQINRLSRQALMTNINSEEIKELMVPHPDPDVQEAMVDDLNDHWDLYRSRMKSARDLLTQGDQEIAQRLGLEPPPSTNPMSWAVRRSGLVAGGRLNAEFFHPERVLTARAILDGKHPAHPLDQVATFVKDKQKGIKPTDFYVGLANVERDTGELRPGTDEDELPTGDVVQFKAGDVLFGKLRPYLNKVHLAEVNGVCSPEFFVLRPNEGVRGEYLAAILRSRLTLTQTRHMAGGNTHPRLTPADVHAMYVPMPVDDAIQHEIADAEAENRVEARKVKAQAGEDWTAAKQRFGDDLVS